MGGVRRKKRCMQWVRVGFMDGGRRVKQARRQAYSRVTATEALTLVVSIASR